MGRAQGPLHTLHALHASGQQSPNVRQSWLHQQPSGAWLPQAPGAAQPQSAGHVEAVSPLSQAPLPQQSPQSAAQLAQVSPGSHTPSTQQMDGVPTHWPDWQWSPVVQVLLSEQESLLS